MLMNPYLYTGDMHAQHNTTHTHTLPHTHVYICRSIPLQVKARRQYDLLPPSDTNLPIPLKPPQPPPPPHTHTHTHTHQPRLEASVHTQVFTYRLAGGACHQPDLMQKMAHLSFSPSPSTYSPLSWPFCIYLLGSVMRGTGLFRFKEQTTHEACSLQSVQSAPISRQLSLPSERAVRNYKQETCIR